jgi:hypothetical protein
MPSSMEAPLAARNHASSPGARPCGELRPWHAPPGGAGCDAQLVAVRPAKVALLEAKAREPEEEEASW